MTRHPSVGHGMGGCIAPITPRRILMSCHPRVTEWTTILRAHLPHLTKSQATVLALWSLGMVLALLCVDRRQYVPGHVAAPERRHRASAVARVLLRGDSQARDRAPRAGRRDVLCAVVGLGRGPVG